MSEKVKKKSFVMHEDWAKYILNLPAEMAGELSQMIMSYALYGEVNEEIGYNNPALDAMFTMIRQTMDEDAQKYQETCEQRRKNAQARWNGIDDIDDIDDIDEMQNDASAYDCIEDNANVCNSIEDDANESESMQQRYDYHNHIHNHNHISSSKKKIEATEIDKRILDYFNSKCNTSYRYKNQEILKLIHGRLDDGFSEDDFKKVIDIKYEDWFDNPKMAKHLKPSTLFRPSHFEEYLNQKTRGEPTSRTDIVDVWAKGEGYDNRGIHTNREEATGSIHTG